MRLHYIFHKPSKKAKRQIELIISNPNFQKAVIKMRDKWKQEFEHEPHTIFDFSDNDEFYLDLNQVMQATDLHDQWQIFVGEYVINNRIDLKFYPDLAFIEERDEKKYRDKITNQPSYYIRIFPTTTKEDVLRALGFFKKNIAHKDGKIPRVRPFKKLDRDAEIVSLKAKGKTRREINKAINVKYGMLDKGHMGKTISKFNHRMKPKKL